MCFQSQRPPGKRWPRREETMGDESGGSTSSIALSRRDLLAGGAALVAQLPHLGVTAATAAPNGSMTLAWHTAMAPRWLDPQDHDGTATPDNFLTALHDALIKNSGTQLYDHPALAERYEFAKDGTNATFWLRDGKIGRASWRERGEST